MFPFCLKLTQICSSIYLCLLFGDIKLCLCIKNSTRTIHRFAKYIESLVFKEKGGSGVIFACGVEMKVPIAGVSTLFTE